MKYPQTRTVEQTDIYHGTEVADPYRWLEDDAAEETSEWVRRQNELTADYMARIPFRDAYRRRLIELFDNARYTSPRRFGDRYFYLKNDGLQEHGVLYMENVDDGAPHVVLDPNRLSSDGSISVSEFSFSSDGAYVAYSTSESGSDWLRIRVRDVATGEDLADCVDRVKFSGIAWVGLSGFLYSGYAMQDESGQAHSNHRLCFHRLGADASEDVVVFERPDEPDWLLFGGTTDDDRYAVIYAHHQGYEKVFCKDLIDPEDPRLDVPAVELAGDFTSHYSLVANDGAELFFTTNDAAPRGRVVAIDITAPGAPRTVIAESEDVLESATVLDNLFVLTYLHNAYNRVLLYDRSGQMVHEIEMPTLGAVFIEEHFPWSTELFFTFTSFLFPNTVFRFDRATLTCEVYRASGLELDEARYHTRQLWCESPDGTRVPYFITGRRDVVLDGTNPTLLYAYGGFSSPMKPSFSRWGMLWLEEGGLFVLANVRGGGEFGKEWHRGGIREHKRNSFDDYIAVAEHLVAQGYTSPRALVAMGGSNGGLLVSAVMCRRPDLFAVVLPQVPVTDMLRFHLFTIGMAWQGDYGLSDDPAMFPILYGYSPYHNVRPGEYPATLVTTADHDDRVVPGHSFKFVARLQACQSAERPVLVRVAIGAGHGAGMPLSMMIDEIGDVVAFAMFNILQNVSTETNP